MSEAEALDNMIADSGACAREAICAKTGEPGDTVDDRNSASPCILYI